VVELRTAEMIKYACNAFHAVKIGFANEIGALAETLGISGAEVMATLCRDTVLNTSPAYLKPGFAFGGSCLPKDLRALTFRASRLDVKLPLLESVLPSNDRHLARTAEAALGLPSGPIAVYGLAFKENTDDLRESPVVSLVEILTGKGRDLRIYDPHIQLDKIYGSNLGFLLSALPHIKRVMVSGIDQLLAGAASLIIMQKPSPEIAERLRAANIPTLDATTGRESVRMPDARS
jgi:GDP-mannose 6-dehydrogenase